MKLSDLENRLKLARDVNDLNNALRSYLSEININTFSFTYYSYYPNSMHKLKYDIASPNFESWHKHYVSEHYEEIDSTLETVYQTTLPTYWELERQLKEAATSREQQMRLDSIKFGAEKGLSIPIHGPNEDFAIFLVVQMTGEQCLEHWQERQYDLFTVGYYYYFYLQAQLLKTQKPIEKYGLNAREIQCLQLIAKQCSTSLIAKKLHITERTVNYHIQRLNKKLGTKNKYQSVTKALQEKLI